MMSQAKIHSKPFRLSTTSTQTTLPPWLHGRVHRIAKMRIYIIATLFTSILSVVPILPSYIFAFLLQFAISLNIAHFLPLRSF